MNINEAGLAIIKEFEGCSLKPYLCPAGVATIGYGHTKGVTMKHKPITKEEAEELLLDDLYDTENSVWHAIHVPITGNQYSAMVSLAFNIGSGNFSKSTLLRLVNEGRYAEAAQQFGRWNKINKEESAGLTRRRTAEAKLFMMPDYVGGKDYA